MQSYSGKAKSYCTERRSISIIYHMIRKIIRFVLVSQIGQAHPAPNHSAHHHLSINCTHLFGINTLIRTHTSLHSVSGRSPTKWIHSNAIQALSRNTYLVYSPFVSPPVCVSAPRANVCSRCHIIVDFLQENVISVFYFKLSRLIQCLCCFLVTRINVPIKLSKIYIETVSAQDTGFSTKSYVKIKY